MDKAEKYINEHDELKKQVEGFQQQAVEGAKNVKLPSKKRLTRFVNCWKRICLKSMILMNIAMLHKLMLAVMIVIMFQNSSNKSVKQWRNDYDKRRVH